MRMPVHPHACGELTASTATASTGNGSSPRMWGTPAARVLVLLIYRFIPTHVGNSQAGGYDPAPAPVHPHACGELIVTDSWVYFRSGSSPRMWGTPGSRSQCPPRSRFIPTHVGNSPPMCKMPQVCPVHPHACGELRANIAFDNT